MQAIGAFIQLGVVMSEKIEQVQAAVAAVKQSVDTLTDAVTAEAAQTAALITKIEELKAQVAAGNAATPEQLDALLVDLQTVQQNLESATAGVAALAPDVVPE
jgi:uncharacterized protein YoxC